MGKRWDGIFVSSLRFADSDEKGLLERASCFVLRGNAPGCIIPDPFRGGQRQGFLRISESLKMGVIFHNASSGVGHQSRQYVFNGFGSAV